MVKIRSFKGFSCTQELAPKLVSPPYDVLDSEEARKMAEGNQYSFLHVNKPEIDLPKDLNPYDPQVYQKGKENLEAFIKNGWLVQEKEPICYVYAQTYQGKTQYGLMCEASVDEDDRTKITDIQNANVGPVFMTYTDVKEIDAVVDSVVKQNKPFFELEFKEMGDIVFHQLWKCPADASILIEKLFAEHVQTLYIADGHHRSASAFNVAKLRKQRAIEEGKVIKGDEDFNFFLSIIYPHNQLRILDYNRVILDTNGKNDETILKDISENFEVNKLGNALPPKLSEKYSFLMFMNKEWYKLILKKVLIEQILAKNDPVSSIDSDVLTKYLITPVFDIRSDERIDFIGGIRGYKELEERCSKDAKLAFAIKPVDFPEVMKIADVGLNMPPKSTWFEPKPRSGCVVRVFQN